MAIKTNLIVDQNANFIYSVYLIDSDGNPFPINDYTGSAQIRRSYTSNTYTPINVSINGNSGIIILSMNASTTANLTYTQYAYDLNLKSNSNVVSRIMEGFVTVNLGITK